MTGWGMLTFKLLINIAIILAAMITHRVSYRRRVTSSLQRCVTVYYVISQSIEKHVTAALIILNYALLQTWDNAVAKP